MWFIDVFILFSLINVLLLLLFLFFFLTQYFTYLENGTGIFVVVFVERENFSSTNKGSGGVHEFNLIIRIQRAFNLQGRKREAISRRIFVF